MRITEIFFSIQGESSHAGKPCVFVRLTGCSLRCVWCDTKYSYGGGSEMSLEQDSVYELMDSLLSRGYTVMLETGGHVSIDRVPREVIKIIDVKCPDSG